MTKTQKQYKSSWQEMFYCSAVRPRASAYGKLCLTAQVGQTYSLPESTVHGENISCAMAACLRGSWQCAHSSLSPDVEVKMLQGINTSWHSKCVYFRLRCTLWVPQKHNISRMNGKNCITHRLHTLQTMSVQ